MEAGAALAVPTSANLEEERAIDLVLLGSEDGGKKVCHGCAAGIMRELA